MPIVVRRDVHSRTFHPHHPHKETVMSARLTLTSLSARIDAQDVKLDAILAALSGGSAATSTPVAEKVATPRTRKAPATTKSSKVSLLTKSSRQAFVAAAAAQGWDVQGWATHEIRSSMEAGLLVVDGWALPQGTVKAAIKAAQA